MSSRRILLVLAVLALTACGFEPLYGTREDAPNTENLLERVTVPPIADRTGQLLRTELVNRLTPQGPAGPPAYTLEVTLSESLQNLAVQRDATATRANLRILAVFTFKPVDGGENLTSGSIRSVNSYDILTSDFATLAAEQDARRRAARDIADAIVARLAVFLSGNPDGT